MPKTKPDNKDLRLIASFKDRLICSLNIEEILLGVLKELPVLMHVESASILIYDTLAEKLRSYYLSGKNQLASYYVAPEQGYSNVVFLNNQPVVINNISNGDYAGSLNLPDELRSVAACPINYNGHQLGVVELFNKRDGFFDKQDLSRLQVLSGAIARSVSGSIMFTELSQSLSQSYEALAEAVDARDHYASGHSRRVLELALELAKKIGYDADRLELLGHAALLHDIGKIRIDTAIITKTGLFSPEEYNIIKMHPIYGAEILEKIEHLKEAVPYVLYHHERYDGLGYPDGLMGEEIPLEARIIALADTYDSLTQKRSYRDKYAFEKAVEEIRRCAGSQFDPELARAFVGTIGAN